MAEPGKETAATPPPLPQETVLQAPAVAEPSLETDAVISASQEVAALPPPAETPAQEIAPPPQETAAVAAVGKPEQTTTEADGQPPLATMPQKVAALPPPAETPAQESAPAAAPTPPPPPPPPEKQEGGAPEQGPSVHEEKDAAASSVRAHEGEETAARRRWRRLRAAMGSLLHRLKGGEMKQPVLPSGLEDKKPTPGETPLPVESAGKPAVEKSEKGEDDMKPPVQDGKKCPLTKKFQMAGRAVQFAMSLYNKHRRSQSQEEEKKKPAAGMGGKEGSEAKRSTSAPEENQQHPNWPREEVRLEDILEEAFTRLLAAEYIKELSGVRQKCLLTFSVFELASEVKKQAMIYWWVAEFNLRHRSDPPAQAPGGGGGGGGAAPPQGKGADADAEGIFFMLSDHGFLVPIKNWCTKVIHGCQVNPLVHWMLKRQARGDRFAELDEKGSPAALQTSSSILCLTAGNRRMLQKMRVADEAQPQAQGSKEDNSRPQSQAGRRSRKVTKENSLQGKESNHVQEQDELQPTTAKEEAQQVGSKSMADKAPSKKDDEDPTQAKDQLTKSKEGNQVYSQHQQQPTTKDEVKRVGSKSMAAAADKAPSKKDDDEPSQAKDQLTKVKEGNHVQDQDQQQPTTKDEVQRVKSKADKAPSKKDDDDELTKGPQNKKPSSEPELAEETIQMLPRLFEGKRVILNVNAHVYPTSKSMFLNLAECLVVLQLGRWNNVDDNTYMEVDGLMESWNAIGLLKNLRYLGLRGLSGLTELPKGIESLEKLEILDMRGCQNLVKVQFTKLFLVKVAVGLVKQLKQLTHLDLTECYMLEHIDQGITSLTELQVFKGFVFATGTQGRKKCRIQGKPCRIQDLQKLKNLQKLTVSITTDANVGKSDMADLKSLTSLRKLTITWSEIPSILEGEKVEKKREELIERWTSFHLPNGLMKLDIRCYPKEKLELEKHWTLEKLYLRGGDMERFSTNNSTSIKTLRLRYLRNFKMLWEDIRSELEKLRYAEIVVKDEDVKLMKEVMKIPEFTLDGHGVWTKDEKEELYQMLSAPNNKDAPEAGAMGKNEASGPSEPAKDSSTKDASATPSVKKDGDDDKAAAK